MSTSFYKYQGTGNDFILIDNRQDVFNKNNTKLIAQMCDRRFGIGADGLILLEAHTELDFNMVYFNADGQQSSMCGNGGRCMVHFAKSLGIIQDTTSFWAIDGLHHASISGNQVALQMQDVIGVEEHSDYCFLNTGSPHHVVIVDNVDNVDVAKEGVHLRYTLYGEAGANINFVSPAGKNTFKVRTYERGVEAETLSCGTGVTAVALAMHKLGKSTAEKLSLETPGGVLNVSFTPQEDSYTNICLAGPATFVFTGIWK